ncbi:transposase [Herbidospora sp. RD11066]
MARFDVTDTEWVLIEPFLPVAATGPLPRWMRDQINGILWRFRTGSGWRDVPERCRPWSTLYSRFSSWAKAEALQELMDSLIAEAASRGQVRLELVSVDSRIVRAHQDSSGLAVARETMDALEQALTEERGLRWRSSPRAAGDAPQVTPGEGEQADGGAAPGDADISQDRAIARRRRRTPRDNRNAAPLCQDSASSIEESAWISAPFRWSDR